MTAMLDLTEADVGILAQSPLSLYAQLDVAQHQALAGLRRMNAAAHDMQVARMTGHGMEPALALFRSARNTRIAALDRIATLRRQIANAEREAGRIHLPRAAAPELRTP